MTVVTRFAPSPTGYLHLGGARTALFNWLFARHHQKHGAGGKFILRIDDTDQARQNDLAVTALIDGLKWLGLDWDEGPIFQHQRLARHAEVAHQLLAAGQAYRCYATTEELEEMRRLAARLKKPPRYDGRWRDRDPSDYPLNQPFVIRLKAPQTGATRVDDLILGEVNFSNIELDDFIILRADGSPTYMLSTVVDDHDLGVTHVIRGNEHFTNAARQSQIFAAMGWPVPRFGHIPLIHAADGTKLSKRHGAVGIEHYREEGFIPLALVDYLARLGWSYGTESFITADERVSRFDGSHINRGPAKFDLGNLSEINFHYLKTMDDEALARVAAGFFAAEIGREFTAAEVAKLVLVLPGLKERAKTLVQLARSGSFYFKSSPIELEPAAKEMITAAALESLRRLLLRLEGLTDWRAESLDGLLHQEAEAQSLKFGQLAQPLRAAITGRTNSPGVSQVLFYLGRDESLARLRLAVG
ncbi:MAG: glutamate--tRNA ligase [Candidatus Pacebacteria bacterium]|nr:glutamate--tRNA ligase [Candidatus Paceibacterota bacterium]